MLYSGLTSVTFRNLSSDEIIELACHARLEGIEWGGDIHVPPSDHSNAKNVKRNTVAAGLKVVSYGSYFRVGENSADEFKEVFNTAIQLEAPMIRIWAGNKGSGDADNEYFDKIVGETTRIADMASRENIRLSFEFHMQTLTDTAKSALRLLEAVNHPNVCTYWQPTWQQPLGTFEYCKQSLNDILPWLSNVHVFHWAGSSEKKMLLADGESFWKRYVDIIRSTKRDHWLLLEFVKDADPCFFLKDAAFLKKLISEEL